MSRPRTVAADQTIRPEDVIERIIWCGMADTLRHGRPRRFAERLTSWLERSGREPHGPERNLTAALAEPDLGLCVIGPGVGRGVERWLPQGPERPPVLDLSGQGLGQAFRDPRRRTLDETWFTIAKSAAEIVLEALIAAAPAPWSDRIRCHRVALLLRLKTDIGLRLRRLEIVAERAVELRAGKVLLIEGEQPLDDLKAHFLSTGVTTECVQGPGARVSIERRTARRAGFARSEPDWQAFAAEFARWAPPMLAVGDRALVAADLRRKGDFRHSRTACDLLAALAAGNADLIQPYTRITWNVRRAAATVGSLGARMTLLRQPQANGFIPALAGVRSALLGRADDALRDHGAFSVGERAAIVEAAGGFIASNLAPSLALADGLKASFERSRPRFVASVPLGSPFGGLVISAARAAGTPTVEIQTLMIGKSDRDPMPVAERIAVLDTSQRDIFAARFGVEPNRFILAGHVELAGSEVGASPPSGRTVLFASQPLEGVAGDALALLAEACVRLGDVRLTLAPHPDETPADIASYRSVLARWPGLYAHIAQPGETPALIGENAVLATVLSNVALRAAVTGRPVLVLDPGIETPLDFERLGLACKARTPTQAATLLADFFADGPAARTLALSRAAYFSANPQLLQAGAVDRIIAAMEPGDEYWRTGTPSS